MNYANLSMTLVLGGLLIASLGMVLFSHHRMLKWRELAHEQQEAIFRMNLDRCKDTTAAQERTER